MTYTGAYRGNPGTNNPNYKDGRSHLMEYVRYKSMLTRCGYTGKVHKNYFHVNICDRWLDSFWNFYEDMGPMPSPKHSLDRINPDGNYEPGNCQWITFDENRLKSKGNRQC